MFPVDVEYIRLAWYVGETYDLSGCVEYILLMCVGEGDTSRSVLLVEVCWILNSDVYGADIDAHTVQ